MHKNTTIIISNQNLARVRFSNPLVVNRAGCFQRVLDHYIKRDGINEYILLLCTEGKGYVVINSQKISISKGYIAILDKNTPHEYGSDNTDPWSILWVHFSGKDTEYYYSLLKDMDANTVFYREDYAQLAEGVRKILACLNATYDTISITQACCHLQLLILSILKPEINANTVTPYLDKAIKFLNANIYRELHLSELSCYLGISTYHLIRIFKKHTHVTPKQYYNNLKIERACNLLSTTSLSVTEISDKLSFNNSFYFSQQFKKIIGESPSAYRRKSQEKY